MNRAKRDEVLLNGKLGHMKEESSDEWEQESVCSCSDCDKHEESDEESLIPVNPRFGLFDDEQVVKESKEEQLSREEREKLMEYSNFGLDDSDDSSLQSWEEDLIEEQNDTKRGVIKTLGYYFDLYQWCLFVGMLVQDVKFQDMGALMTLILCLGWIKWIQLPKGRQGTTYQPVYPIGYPQALLILSQVM